MKDILKRINNIIGESTVVTDVADRFIKYDTKRKTFPNTEEIRNYVLKKGYKIIFKDEKKIIVEI